MESQRRAAWENGGRPLTFRSTPPRFHTVSIRPASLTKRRVCLFQHPFFLLAAPGYFSRFKKLYSAPIY